jgi:hypothetical protein
LAADGWGWQRVGWLLDKEHAGLEEGQQGWTSRAFRKTETETTAGLDIILERKTCKRTNEK